MFDDDDEHDIDEFSRIIQELVINRLDAVINDMTDDDVPKEDFPQELRNRLFDKNLEAELGKIGMSLEDCAGIQFNIYEMDMTDKEDLIDQIESTDDPEERARIIGEEIDKHDRYITNKSEDDIVSYNSYKLKEKLDGDTIDPISEDQFKKMFGESNED